MISFIVGGVVLVLKILVGIVVLWVVGSIVGALIDWVVG